MVGIQRRRVGYPPPFSVEQHQRCKDVGIGDIENATRGRVRHDECHMALWNLRGGHTVRSSGKPHLPFNYIWRQPIKGARISRNRDLLLHDHQRFPTCGIGRWQAQVGDALERVAVLPTSFLHLITPVASIARVAINNLAGPGTWC